MSGLDGAVIADTIRTLATLVRLHEGNKDEQVNALLLRAEECVISVTELSTLVNDIERCMNAKAAQP